MPVWTGVSNGLAGGDVGGDDFYGAGAVVFDWSFAVYGFAERVDYAGQQGVADGDFYDSAGAADAGAFLDGEGVSHDDGAYGVFFEVEGHAHHAAFEFQQFGVCGAGQSVDLGYAVAYFYDGAFVDRFELLLPVFYLAPDYGGYVLPSDGHFGTPSFELLVFGF